MAIQNSATLTTTGGLTVPANNVVISAVHFPQPTLNLNDEGNWDGTITRPITYDLFVYVSKAEVQNPKGTAVGAVTQLPSGWQKDMTPAEYAALLADGTLAEEWLRQYIQSLIGGTSVIIDPYV